MASEEQLNNQKEFNSALADAQEFIGLITSRTSDLVDAFRRLNNRSRDVTRDQSEALKILKSINTAARNLTSEYSSLKEITNKIKEAKKDQIKLDNTILSLEQKLEDSQKSRIEAFQKGQSEINKREQVYARLVEKSSKESVEAANQIISLRDEISKKQNAYSELEKNIDKKSYEEKKKKEAQLLAAKKLALDELNQAQTISNKKSRREAEESAARKLTALKEEEKILKNSYTAEEKRFDAAREVIKEKQNELQIEESLADQETNTLIAAQTKLNLSKDEFGQLSRNLSIQEKQYLQLLEAKGEHEKILKFLEEQEEKTAKTLKEQEEKQNRINKSLGLFNLTLGAASGLLEGLGLKGASIALGFEEGKKAAEEMARKIESGEESVGILGKNIKVLGEGIKATIGSIAGDIKKALSFTALVAGVSKLFGGLVRNIASMIGKGLKGAFNVLISPAKQVVSEIGGLFSEGIDYIKNSFFSVKGFMDSFKEGESLMKELSLATEKIATDLGVSTKEAQGLTNQVAKFSGEMGAFPEVLAANMVELNKAFGTTMEFSDATARSYNRLIERAGFAAGEAAEFVKLSQLQGESVNDTLKGYEDEIMYQKAINNSAVSQKEVLQEIAKASSATRLTFRGQGKSLAEAAFQAKSLGLEMSKLEDIGGSLLNFEDSIAKEMEAELLIGKDLNLERARQAALQGDSATLAKELAKNIGSAAEFGKKNVIQQEALAAAVGMTRDELAKTLETQELLAGTGLSDMNQAQAEYNKMLEETGDAEKAAAKFRQKYGNEALSQQVAKVAYAKQDELRQRQLVATQMEMAKAMLPVAQAFRKIVQYVQDLRAILIDKMQPFFKAFGGLVGQGGKSFKEMAEGPVGKLGEKLNEIGLKLVEFFKTHGPEIKNIFSKIFDVFGAIYSKVAEIIGKVFEMGGGADKMASGAFGSIADILDKVIEKINGIDVEALIKDIKGFIEGVKDAFSFIKKIFDKIATFAKDNPNLAKILGGGALTIGLGSKVAPELTKAILGAGGNLIKMAGAKTLDLAKGAGNFLSSKLGFGKIFGMTQSDKENLGTSSSNPMYVEVTNAGDIGGGGGAASEGLTDMVGKIGGRKAGIGGGFRGGVKGALSYARDAFKGGRAGKVGRARLIRAAKGLVTGKGPSFVGGVAKASKVASTAAQTGKAVSTAAQVGKVASTGLKLAKGAAGGIGSLLGGLALDYAAEKSKEKAVEKREAAKSAKTPEEKEKLLKEAKKAEGGGRLASVGSAALTGAGMGSMIGSVIPGIGTAIGGAIGGAVGGAVGIYQQYFADEASKLEKMREGLADKQNAIADRQMQMDELSQKAELDRQRQVINSTNSLTKEFDKLKESGKSEQEALKDFGNNLVATGKVSKEQLAEALKNGANAADLIAMAGENLGNELNNLADQAGQSATDRTQTKVQEAEQKIIASGGKGQAELDLLQQQVELGRGKIEGGQVGADLSKEFDFEGLLDSKDATSILEDIKDGSKEAIKFQESWVNQFRTTTGASMEEAQKAFEAAMSDPDLELDAEGIQQSLMSGLEAYELSLQDQGMALQDYASKLALDEAKFQSLLTGPINTAFDSLAATAGKDTKAALDQVKGVLGEDFDKLAGDLAKDGAISPEDVKEIQRRAAKMGADLKDATINNLSQLGGGPTDFVSQAPDEFKVPTAEAEEIQPTGLAALGTDIMSLLGIDDSSKEQIKKWAIDSFESVKTIGAETWNSITETASGAWEGIKGFGSGIWDSINSAGVKSWESLTSTASAAWEGIKGFGSGIWGGISEAASSIWGSTEDGTGIAGAASMAWTSIQDKGSEVWSSIKSTGESIWEGISSVAGSAWEGIKGKGKEIWGSIKGKGKEIWGSIEGFAKGPIDKIKSTFSGIFNLDSGIIGKTKDIFKNLLPDSVLSVMTSLGIIEEEKKPTPPPKPQNVKDGSTVSNKGPFTISDRFGNIAVTHPQDKLVVSPNISYVNDGISSPSRNQVFPVSEGFGMLDVKVSPKGVMVQKINDGISDKEIDKTKQEIWDKYKGENRRVIPGKPGIYAWDSVNEKMFFINETAKSSSQVTFANSETFHNYTRVPERELIGVRSDMGFANPDKINLNTLKNLIYEAFGASETNPAGVGRKGNESTLDSILDPFQPDLVRQTIKGYAPVPPTKTTYFHTLPNKEGYRPPDLISMGQSASEGLSLEGAAVQQVQDAISPWEIFSNPIGAVKHYLLPVIVEESGHIIKSLFKSKTLLAPLKAILKKTPIIGHAMHAATGAINISHLLHKEGVTRDKLDQEVGKAALTTLGGIGGGILGTMLVGTLGTLATGPAGMVLSVLGGTVGGILGEMFAGFVADKLGARPVGSPIVSLFHQEHNKLHPPTSASPNLAHTAPKPKTSPQRVSDGSSSSKGPFTIADRFGNVAVTHPKDGIVVSPNISYVNDGVTGKKGPVFPVSEKFGALDVKVSPKGVMVQKVNDGVGSNLVSVSQSISENLSLEEAAMPKLAEGGMVSKPTVALIGEAGPEAVVPLDQIAQESPQTSTTVIESDNSDLKKELQEMKQLMAGLISQIPSIANRPITVELNGNKVGQALGQNAYRM